VQSARNGGGRWCVLLAGSLSVSLRRFPCLSSLSFPVAVSLPENCSAVDWRHRRRATRARASWECGILHPRLLTTHTSLTRLATAGSEPAQRRTKRKDETPASWVMAMGDVLTRLSRRRFMHRLPNPFVFAQCRSSCGGYGEFILSCASAGASTG